MQGASVLSFANALCNSLNCILLQVMSHFFPVFDSAINTYYQQVAEAEQYVGGRYTGLYAV